MSERLFHNRYRIERRIGRGGMSVVELAFDTRLERYVAVKQLAEHLADDPGFVSRFQREALAAARLVHPNIVQVFDSGFDPELGRHFIVMEYVEGKSCAQMLSERGRIPVEEAVELIAQACAGLDYAHRHGVVHRDVKPGNLLYSKDGVLKLADFGIAKATEQSSITQVGSVLGTAAYLAPEQAQGEEAGPGADIYALGVVAYQLLSGSLPYEAGSLTELALAQQEALPPALDQMCPDVPPALGTVIDQALALTPEERYESALGFANALHQGLSWLDPTASTKKSRRGRSVEATRVINRADGSGTSVMSSQRRNAAPKRPSSRRTAANESRRNDRAPERSANAKKGGRSAFSVLAVFVALAATVAAVVFLPGAFSNKPKLREVVYPSAQQSIDAMRQLVDDNKR